MSRLFNFFVHVVRTWTSIPRGKDSVFLTIDGGEEKKHYILITGSNKNLNPVPSVHVRYKRGKIICVKTYPRWQPPAAVACRSGEYFSVLLQTVATTTGGLACPFNQRCLSIDVFASVNIFKRQWPLARYRVPTFKIILILVGTSYRALGLATIDGGVWLDNIIFFIYYCVPIIILYFFFQINRG